MGIRLYPKRMVLGGLYDLNINYKGKRFKIPSLRFIKVTSKGYNFLDEETNKVSYKGRHFYESKKIKSKHLHITLPYWLRVFRVSETEWIDATKESISKLTKGVYWLKYENVSLPRKVLFDGVTFSELNGHIIDQSMIKKHKEVIYEQDEE